MITTTQKTDRRNTKKEETEKSADSQSEREVTIWGRVHDGYARLPTLLPCRQEYGL